MPNDADDELYRVAPEVQVQSSRDDNFTKRPRKTALGLIDPAALITLYADDGKHLGTMSLKEGLSVARRRHMRLFILDPLETPALAQLLQLQNEWCSLKILPQADSHISNLSQSCTLVLNVNIRTLVGANSVDEVSDKIKAMMMRKFGTFANELLSDECLSALAVKVWNRLTEATAE